MLLREMLTTQKSRLATLTVALALCVGCSASEEQEVGPVELETNYQLDGLADRATEILTQIEAVESCDDQIGPTDELYSPVQVGHIYCKINASDVNVFTYADRAGIRYHMQTVDLGSGDGRAFLVGSDWLVAGSPDLLREIEQTFDGSVYTNDDSAYLQYDGYSESDAFVVCHQFLASAAVDYVASGTNSIPQLDEYTVPGVKDKFNEQLVNVVPKLASFERGDVQAAVSDLLPYAQEIRNICRELA